jgi:drug/metabolite transporter (DMT)-like permease
MMAQVIEWLRERSGILKGFFFAFLVFAVAFDFLIERHDPHFWGDEIIGFWSLFALLGCLGLIVVFKGISHVWLQKEEDYYDR